MTIMGAVLVAILVIGMLWAQEAMDEGAPWYGAIWLVPFWWLVLIAIGLYVLWEVVTEGPEARGEGSPYGRGSEWQPRP